MGVSISGTVIYGKPLVASLANMPAVVVALSEAVIDKTYLTWLDVSKLLKAFPEHVKLVGDTVTFQGPVAIVSSMSPTRRLIIQCSLAAALGGLHYLFFSRMLAKGSYAQNHRGFLVPPPLSRLRMIRIACFTLAGAYLGFYAAGRLLPTQAGVYFYKQPPFLV